MFSRPDAPRSGDLPDLPPADAGGSQAGAKGTERFDVLANTRNFVWR